MEWTVISAVVGTTMAVTTAIGGLLLKAYVNPVKQNTEANSMIIRDHEDRLRHLESKAAAHDIHLENLMKAVDRLVNKIDELVSYEKSERNRHRED